MRITRQGNWPRRASAWALVRPRPNARAAVARSTVVVARSMVIVTGVIGVLPRCRSGVVGKVGRARGDDDPGKVQGVDLDVFTGLRGLDDLSAAEVHHDVAGVAGGAVGAGGEQQVAGLDLGQRDLGAVLAPLVGGAGDVDARGRVSGVDQARAVVGVRGRWRPTGIFWGSPGRCVTLR